MIDVELKLIYVNQTSVKIVIVERCANFHA